MWTYLYFTLFLGTLIALILVINAFTRRISELEKARTKLQIEETRVFDFLHGLGEAFSEGVRSTDLHRLIVEGAIRILEAHGGVLYLTDKSGSTLVPAFVSKGCPPLLPIPPNIVEQAIVMPSILESFVKLHSVKKEEGLIGQVWRNNEPCLVKDNELDFKDHRSASLIINSALVAPLIYRRKTLGLLALANCSTSTPFTEDDLTLFRNISEQSAFALYNEIIYSEASEKKRLDHDLEIAREIQSILLPSSAPQFDGYEIDGINIPARRVSGDYFDYIPISGDKLAVAVADVSGKGIPASLIMAMCRSVIRSQADTSKSAAEVLKRVNYQLYPDIKEDMFISMAYVILGHDSGEATLARAGHDPPLWYRASTQTVEQLNPKGMALGIDSGHVFDRVCYDFSFTMEPGDCLLLYTDGATEALDDQGFEFGLTRLIEGLQTSANHGASAIIRQLTDDMKSFIGPLPQYDDITLIAIRKL